MNTQFHTPSFGDEFVDVQQQVQSKRVRGMESSFDEYQHQSGSASADESSFVSAASNLSLVGSSPVQQQQQQAMFLSGSSNVSPNSTTTLAARKQLVATAADPNEPAKPLSAYALFFRDTVSAIKQQNPNCSFQELSRIVASMWEALDPVHKNVYHKKNELARNDYVKQLQIYRQQQQQQQQLQLDQQQLEQQQQQRLPHEQLSNNTALQTRPAVFTIAQSTSVADFAASAAGDNFMNSLLPQPQQQLQLPTQCMQQAQQQQHFNISPQPQQPQPQQQLLSAMDNNNTVNALGASLAASSLAADNAAAVANTPADPSPPQMQMLTEAGSVQKCTRENCNKRAIINPDWEDEYCSNECVVIHCRNVFNSWVQANLDVRKQ